MKKYYNYSFQFGAHPVATRRYSSDVFQTNRCALEITSSKP